MPIVAVWPTVRDCHLRALWRCFLLLSTGPARRFLHRIAAGNKTLHQRAGEAVLAEPAGGLTATIKPANDMTRAIDDLAFGVDA